jgi:hypothetical protein
VSYLCLIHVQVRRRWVGESSCGTVHSQLGTRDRRKEGTKIIRNLCCQRSLATHGAANFPRISDAAVQLLPFYSTLVRVKVPRRMYPPDIRSFCRRWKQIESLCCDEENWSISASLVECLRNGLCYLLLPERSSYATSVVFDTHTCRYSVRGLVCLASTRCAATSALLASFVRSVTFQKASLRWRPPYFPLHTTSSPGPTLIKQLQAIWLCFGALNEGLTSTDRPLIFQVPMGD